MTALLDTGFLLAVIDEGDSLHDTCVAALQNENSPLLPDVVLPELAYLILREMGYHLKYCPEPCLASNHRSP